MSEHVISDSELDALLDRVASNAANTDRRLHREILRTALGFAADDTDRLDLKITTAAMAEMRQAFATFAPYRDRRKVTVFGSARALPDDPLYAQAVQVAADLAGRGWMAVTGAGPGIMAAGMEGAGRENSLGVTIRLPFEEAPNEFIAGDPKLVDMKYFFTRKLMLVKESSAYIVLPGGFGTQDETFELFTLMQTGKSEPAPVVLLDTPGGTYWHNWVAFVKDELLSAGMISEPDLDLFLVTDDPVEACQEIVNFHRNYRSLRWVGDRLILRLHHAPDPAELRSLNEDFSAEVVTGRIEVVEPFRPEIADDDDLDAKRIAIHFNRYRMSRLRTLIDRLNRLPSLEDA